MQCGRRETIKNRILLNNNNNFTLIVQNFKVTIFALCAYFLIIYVIHISLKIKTKLLIFDETEMTIIYMYILGFTVCNENRRIR